MHHRNITRQSFIAAIERGIHAAPGLDAATRQGLRHVAEHATKAAAGTSYAGPCPCPFAAVAGRPPSSMAPVELNFADAYDDWIDRYYGAAPTTRSIELTVLG
jgi:hypothetical protein